MTRVIDARPAQQLGLGGVELPGGVSAAVEVSLHWVAVALHHAHAGGEPHPVDVPHPPSQLLHSLLLVEVLDPGLLLNGGRPRPLILGPAAAGGDGRVVSSLGTGTLVPPVTLNTRL